MKKINNYRNFIKEMASYNETMNLLDLIYVLEQADQDKFIVSINFDLFDSNSESDNRYIVENFIEIPSDNMIMDNIGYNTNFDGKKYNFLTYEVESNPNKLYSTKARFEIDENLESILPPHKTIGDHVKKLKKITNPESYLFFIPSNPVGYNPPGDYKTTFAAPMALGNYNIRTYALAKKGEIVSGNILEAYMFMEESKERGGQYHYTKK